MTTKSRRKTCKDCGSKEEVINGLCYACETDNHAYCNICEEFINIDDALYRHRHIFEIGDAWLGSGGVDMDERYEQKIKQALFAVLDKTGIAVPLARTIQHGQMGFEAIHFYGDSFGYYGVDCYLEDEEGKILHDCGKTFTEDITDEQESVMAYGVRWLISLDNKTKDANELTLKWIGEWQKRGVA